MGEDLLTCNVLKNKDVTKLRASLVWLLPFCTVILVFGSDISVLRVFPLTFIFSYITLDQISFWLHFFPSDLDVDHLSGWGSVQLFSWHVLEKGSLLMNVWTYTENIHDLKSLQFMWRAEEENIVHKASDIKKTKKQLSLHGSSLIISNDHITTSFIPAYTHISPRGTFSPLHF